MIITVRTAPHRLTHSNKNHAIHTKAGIFLLPKHPPPAHHETLSLPAATCRAGSMPEYEIFINRIIFKNVRMCMNNAYDTYWDVVNFLSPREHEVVYTQCIYARTVILGLHVKVNSVHRGIRTNVYTYLFIHYYVCISHDWVGIRGVYMRALLRKCRAAGGWKCACGVCEWVCESGKLLGKFLFI